MNRKVKHGTAATYSNYSCRCPACREAHAKYQRKWRMKVKEAR